MYEDGEKRWYNDTVEATVNIYIYIYIYIIYIYIYIYIYYLTWFTVKWQSSKRKGGTFVVTFSYSEFGMLSIGRALNLKGVLLW